MKRYAQYLMMIIAFAISIEGQANVLDSKTIAMHAQAIQKQIAKRNKIRYVTYAGIAALASYQAYQIYKFVNDGTTRSQSLEPEKPIIATVHSDESQKNIYFPVKIYTWLTSRDTWINGAKNCSRIIAEALFAQSIQTLYKSIMHDETLTWFIYTSAPWHRTIDRMRDCADILDRPIISVESSQESARDTLRNDLVQLISQTEKIMGYLVYKETKIKNESNRLLLKTVKNILDKTVTSLVGDIQARLERDEYRSMVTIIMSAESTIDRICEQIAYIEDSKWPSRLERLYTLK